MFDVFTYLGMIEMPPLIDPPEQLLFQLLAGAAEIRRLPKYQSRRAFVSRSINKFANLKLASLFVVVPRFHNEPNAHQTLG